MSDEEELAELTALAEKRGFRVVHDHTWGYVLWRIDRPTTDPSTHSDATLADLREMVEGIDWGIRHGTIEGWPHD
jgi:hypothetical protein